MPNNIEVSIFVSVTGSVKFEKKIILIRRKEAVSNIYCTLDNLTRSKFSIRDRQFQSVWGGGMEKIIRGKAAIVVAICCCRRSVVGLARARHLFRPARQGKSARGKVLPHRHRVLQTLCWSRSVESAAGAGRDRRKCRGIGAQLGSSIRTHWHARLSSVFAFESICTVKYELVLVI